MSILSCLFSQLRHCIGSLQQLVTDSTSVKHSNSKVNCKASSKSKFAAVAGYLYDENPMTAVV